MLLKTFHIRDFQSVRDSNPIDVGDITCLVGKNEAGKTALLRALYRLNPITKSEDRFDVTDDYPRSQVTEYEQQVNSGKQPHAIVTSAVFIIEAQELARVEEHFGNGVLPEGTLALTRGYENKTDFVLKVDEKVAGETLLAAAHLLEPLRDENLQWNSLKDLASVLQTRGDAQQASFNQATRNSTKSTVRASKSTSTTNISSPICRNFSTSTSITRCAAARISRLSSNALITTSSCHRITQSSASSNSPD
jgi:predicted ATP-dependent endonuclease of OLD family